MALSNERSKRKPSGGLYKAYRKKRLFNLASDPTFTKLGERKVKAKREKSGSLKFILLSADKVNILDPKTKKTQITEIVNVIENPANRNFVRRNIITKGSIVETKLGKARITSRPGQESNLNAILI